MASNRTPSLRESDRLLERIRELVRQTDRDDHPSSAALRAQRREIEDLKSQLAELVKRNPTGDRHG